MYTEPSANDILTTTSKKGKVSLRFSGKSEYFVSELKENFFNTKCSDEISSRDIKWENIFNTKNINNIAVSSGYNISLTVSLGNNKGSKACSAVTLSSLRYPSVMSW